MQMKYCAYSYLDESSSLCDYEVATDKLASLTALCAHYVKVIDSDDLQLLTSMIYHANGSIRLEIVQLRKKICNNWRDYMKSTMLK